MPHYDPDMIAGHFDKDPLMEWERLTKSARGMVQLHLHNHYLHKYINAGDRVLEIGPGPGRFTIELAKLGCMVSIVDISEQQLKMNELKVSEAGFESSIECRRQLDVLDLEGISDNEYDATVCYGGLFSYVLEFVDKAMSEVIRVTKPGGIILTSVMSLLGTYHHLIKDVFQDQEIGLDEFDELTKHGDVVGKLAAGGSHQCHMYRWSEFQEVLFRHPVEVLDVSAANYLSNGHYNDEYLSELSADAEKWKLFLKWELDFCKEEGAIDAGTHFIVILKNGG